ncbi:MAG: ribonuclease III [Lachnospiraceae bacterium]|nr:ribonuclease III [Lachnospiraceae bacterium]
MNINELEQTIGYIFTKKEHIELALTHSSYANEKKLPANSYNERIEFLGDAILEFVTSSFLYTEYPTMNEGEMTKLRAKLVCEESLAASAREINLGSYLLLGKGEITTNGNERDSILSDAFEAVIGAIYMDGGIDNASKFIKKYVLNDIEHKKLFYDSKTTLQELVQGRFKRTVTYKVIDENGPQHNKIFTVAAYIGNQRMETGKGPSKKAAAQDAAYKTILMLNQDN